MWISLFIFLDTNKRTWEVLFVNKVSTLIKLQDLKNRKNQHIILHQEKLQIEYLNTNLN